MLSLVTAVKFVFPLVTLHHLSHCRWFCLVYRLLLSFSFSPLFSISYSLKCLAAGVPVVVGGTVWFTVWLRYKEGGVIYVVKAEL